MSLRLTNALFQSARTVNGAGQIKNTIELTVDNLGNITSGGEPLNILNLGNKGDHCVTRIAFTVPTLMQSDYAIYFIVDILTGVYIQQCTKNDQNQFEAWIEDFITLNMKNVNMLFVAIEENTLDQNGNITEETEIFVSDEFYGQVEQNFLTSGWHSGTIAGEDITVGENTILTESLPGRDDPSEYETMHWVNDETPLDAANMNNIMLGIDTLFADKQDKLTFDDVPTEDSDNPVKSGGVFTAVSGKANETDLGAAIFTPVNGVTVNMQHSYKIGNIVFVHLNINVGGLSISSTGLYDIGTISKHAAHEHTFPFASKNSATGTSTDCAILATTGGLKARFTSTTGGSGYNHDLCFFFCENN